jgi:hypothetical protein
MGSVRMGHKCWYISYYKGGRRFRESSHSTNRANAVRLLKQREGEIATGQPLGILVDRVTFEDLADDFLRDYEVNGKRSAWKAAKSVERLRECFGG